MGFTNKQVAERFVAGHPRGCGGSNTTYVSPAKDSRAPRTFMSYSTDVAVISYCPTTGAEQLWWMDYRSQSTMRQLSYVHTAWRNKHIGLDPAAREANTFRVAYPGVFGCPDNVMPYLKEAQGHLSDMVLPRKHEATRIRLWQAFLHNLAYAEKIMAQIPLVTAVPGSMYELHERLSLIRDGNPTGLNDNMAETILRVRAILALQGN